MFLLLKITKLILVNKSVLYMNYLNDKEYLCLSGFKLKVLTRFNNNFRVFNEAIAHH